MKVAVPDLPQILGEEIRALVHRWVPDPGVQPLLLHLYQNPGKGFRFRYALELGEWLSAPEEAAKTIGLVSEMIHTASLIHDDLVDGARMRRGVPALHRVAPLTTSVLTGDLLLGVAYAHAATTLSSSSLRLLGPAMLGLAYGEVKETLLAGSSPHRSTLELIVAGKTGTLFSWIGAALAFEAGKQEQSGALWDLGVTVGRAFQLMDDLGDRLGVLPGKDPHLDEVNRVPTLLTFLEKEGGGEGLRAEVSSLRKALEEHFGAHLPSGLLWLLHCLEAYTRAFLEHREPLQEGDASP